MKYILLPILKFVWALILTIILIPSHILSTIIILIYIIWYLRFPTKNDIKELYKYHFSWRSEHVSPYYVSDQEWHERDKMFKSYFHYIWNIN